MIEWGYDRKTSTGDEVNVSGYNRNGEYKGRGLTSYEQSQQNNNDNNSSSGGSGQGSWAVFGIPLFLIGFIYVHQKAEYFFYDNFTTIAAIAVIVFIAWMFGFVIRRVAENPGKKLLLTAGIAVGLILILILIGPVRGDGNLHSILNLFDIITAAFGSKA